MPRRNPTLAAEKARRWIEYAGIRILALIIRILGIDLASNVMGWTWRKIGPRTLRHTRVVENLKLAFPDRTATELEEISDAQWDNLGRTFAESFLVDRFLRNPDRFKFASENEIEGRQNDDRGFVAVSLHSGNWELALAPLAHELRVIGLYQRLTNPLVDAFLLRRRRHVFKSGLLSKGRGTTKEAMQFVRGGGVVGMLADTRERKGVKVEFLVEWSPRTPFLQ